MTAQEVIATIRAEIESRKEAILSCPESEIVTLEVKSAIRTMAKGLLSFLSDLEKSEKPMNLEGLEEEIDRFEDWMETYNQADYPTSFTTRDIARHFAQWGAEHSGSSEIPNDLEEAAESFAFKSLDDVVMFGCTLSGRRACFIAGAKWQYQKDRGEFAKIKAKTWCEGFDACKEQMPLPEDTVLFNKGVEEGKRLMMEEAVEGRVLYNDGISFPVSNEIHRLKLIEGDRVRVIIVKEDEK